MSQCGCTETISCRVEVSPGNKGGNPGGPTRKNGCIAR